MCKQHQQQGVKSCCIITAGDKQLYGHYALHSNMKMLFQLLANLKVFQKVPYFCKKI